MNKSVNKSVNVSINKPEKDKAADFFPLMDKHCRELKPLKTEIIEKTPPLNGLKAVLFDIYGTLLISGAGDISHGSQIKSENTGAGKLNDLCRFYKLNLSAAALEERLKTEIKSAQKKITTRQNILVPEIQIEKVWGKIIDISTHPEINSFKKLKKLALEYELIVNPVWPMPQAQTVIKKINADYKTGIISNAQFFTPYILEYFFNEPLKQTGFSKSLIFYSYRYYTAKPAALMFQKAAAALAKCGITTAQTLYVGNDRLNDIAAAAENGFKTCLFAGDRRSLRQRKQNARARAAVPDTVITNLRSLDKVLNIKIPD